MKTRFAPTLYVILLVSLLLGATTPAVSGLAQAAALDPGSTPAISGPGWYSPAGPPVTPDAARRVLSARQSTGGPGRPDRLSALPASEAEITPEIAALAEALDHDPRLIFDYVHNHIDYVPTFGSLNGATATLLAGRGNDWDQASLLIALLRASGFSASYAVGDVTYSGSRLANWVGAQTSSAAASVLATGGVPGVGVAGGYRITRAWVQAQIGGQTYTFDPAMKEYSSVAGIGLAAATGYDRAQFLARAQQGAVVTADYAQAINEANLHADLASASMALVHTITSTMPAATLAEVTGGRRIVATALGAYPTALPYALGVANTVTYTSVPAQYRHTLRIEHRGIDRTFATYEISGQRLTLFYDAAGGAPVLRVGGTGIVTGSTTISGTYATMTITVDHPYAAFGGTYGDQWAAFGLYSGSAYAVLHDWNATSPALLARHSQALSEALAAGAAPTSEPVLGQSLALMCLQVGDQNTLFAHILGNVGGAVPIHHHIVGVLHQETGYGMDIQMGMTSLISADGVAPTEPLHRAYSLFGSALEHGVLEQMQGSDHPAVSTIKLLTLANRNGHSIYQATATNWATVRPTLTGYAPSMLAWIDAGIAAGYTYILPSSGNLVLNDWSGAAFAQISSGGGIGMIIWGGYGGASSFQEPLDPQKLANQANQGLPHPDKAGDVNTPTSLEPVDMVSGAYTYHATDLNVGPAEPLGLHVRRSYNSGDARTLGVLGYGWRHGYEMTLSTHSAYGPGLGQRQPTDAAALIAYAFIAADLLSNMQAGSPDVTCWVSAHLATAWAMDQLIENAVTADLGGTALTYVRLADGTLNPPPGVRQALVATGDIHVLQGTAYDSLTFDSFDRVQSWQDANGNGMAFTYDGGGRLHTVTDAFGRTLTYAYTGGRLTSITDFAGRVLRYSYTADRLTTHRDAANQPWTYGYDARNRLITLTMPKGNTVTTNSYDDRGRVTEQADAYGNLTQFAFAPLCSAIENPDGSRIVYWYDAGGRTLVWQDAAGNRARNAYDGQGRLVSATDRRGHTSTYTYDALSGRLATFTNAMGDPVTHTYAAQHHTFAGVPFTVYNDVRIDYADGSHETSTFDPHGNVTAYTDRAGQVSTFTYNARGQLLTASTPTGGTTTYTYNAAGLPLTSTSSDMGTTTFAYDTLHRLSSVTHPGGAAAAFTYDLSDAPLSTTDELGHTTTTTYDANGNRASVTDPLSRTTTFAYDVMDRLVSRTDPLGQTDAIAYDAMGRIASSTDRNGNTTTYGYDPRGWLQSLTDPQGNTWSMTYDAEGTPIASTTPLSHTLHFATDLLGRVTTVTDAEGAETTFTYDVLGQVTEFTDRLGRPTTYGYDANGRLVQVARPAAGAMAYERDAGDLITRIENPLGNAWTMDYTSMGHTSVFTDPLGAVWSYTYNPRGRLTGIAYPGGGTAAIAYDDAGQMTDVTYSGGPTLTYSYDAAGRLLDTQHLALTYDARGDVVATRDGATTFGATYDDAQRLRTVTYGGQMVVTYTYDTRDLLVRVEDGRSGAWIDFTYDDDGRLTGLERASGVDTTYTYDDVGRVVRIQDGTLADQQYTLNAEGEPVAVARALPLDPLPDLDPTGTSLTFDAAYQISSPGYAYDSRGRLIAAPGRTFTYDGASRLTRVVSGTLSVDLGYNGQGNLRSRTVLSSTTLFYYNYAINLAPVMAEAQETTFRRFYVYTPDGRLLYAVDPATNQPRFYHFDRTGSTLFLSNAAGTVTDAYAYDPYGRLLARTGSDAQPFTYVGRYGIRWEPVGALYDMRARAYDPVASRFLTRDPAWPTLADILALNPYQYANQNPLAYVDPRGLWKYPLNTYDPLSSPRWNDSSDNGTWSYNPHPSSPSTDFQPYATATVDALNATGTLLEGGSRLSGLLQLDDVVNLLNGSGKPLLGQLGYGTGLTIFTGIVDGAVNTYVITTQGAAGHYQVYYDAAGARLVRLVTEDGQHNAHQVDRDLNTPWLSTGIVTRAGAELGNLVPSGVAAAISDVIGAVAGMKFDANTTPPTTPMPYEVDSVYAGPRREPYK